MQDIITSQFRTFTSEEYLLIDIANNIGLDKKPYEERINYSREFISKIDLKNISDDKLKQQLALVNAEEPIIAFAGLKAYKDYLLGNPSGYTVSFDSVCSGIQILSALSADIKGMYYTGILGNTRNDLYMEVAKKYMEISGQSFGMDAKTLRPKIKDAVMTNAYGSIDRPRKLLGKENLGYFDKAMKETIPEAYLLKNLLVKQWDSTKDIQQWVLPDGYTAYCPVKVDVKREMLVNDVPMLFKYKVQQPSPYELSNGANTVHSIDGYIMREMVRRCMQDKDKTQYILHLCNQAKSVKQLSTYMLSGDNKQLDKLIMLYEGSKILTIEILDHIKDISDLLLLSQEHRDKLEELLSLLDRQPFFEIQVVHDCFKCLPKYTNYLRYQYNHILANIVDSNLMNFLLVQVTPTKITLPMNTEFRKQLANLVLNSNYGIC